MSEPEEMSEPEDEPNGEDEAGNDDHLALPLEFEEAMKALLAVDPNEDDTSS